MSSGQRAFSKQASIQTSRRGRELRAFWRDLAWKQQTGAEEEQMYSGDLLEGGLYLMAIAIFIMGDIPP